MVAVIDHLSFPHIIDCVWSYMTLPSAAVSRNVCSEWRRRADRILQHHMVLHTSFNDSAINVRVKSWEEASPPYPSYQAPLTYMDPFLNFSAWPSGALDFRRNLRILDIPRPWAMDDASRYQLTGFLVDAGADQDVCQFLPDWPIDTGVYNRFHLHEPHPPVFFVPFGLDSRILNHLKLNGRIRQVVVTIDCPSFEQSPFSGDFFGRTLQHVLTLRLPNVVKESLIPELIVIFRRGAHFQAPINVTPDIASARLAAYLDDVWKFSPVTVVGVDDFFVEQALHEELRASLLWRAALPEDFLFRFEVLSSDEYRQRVGPELFRLQTIK